MENTKDLYTGNDLEIMSVAEAALERGSDRLQEIKNFAVQAGIKRVGLAYCMAVTKEAQAVKRYLSDFFEVVDIDCKNGRIPKGELLANNSTGISCNPIGQAAYLAENGTQLNIVMGLCVGHDMIFGMHTAVPTTTLLVKDRVNKHNPMVGIKQVEEKAL